MNLLLKFDYYSCVVYMPDGYVTNFPKLQLDFFEWLYNHSEFIKENFRGNVGISYNEREFLDYLNDVVLSNSSEKAYIIPKENRLKGKVVKLVFWWATKKT